MDNMHDGARPGEEAGSPIDGAGAPDAFELYRLVAFDGPWLDVNYVPIANDDLPFSAKTLELVARWAEQRELGEGLRDPRSGEELAQRAADEAHVAVLSPSGEWHYPGGEPVRTRYRALRFFGEYGTALPWWSWYPWPEDSDGPLDEHDMRQLGASEELIEAGRSWNARWDEWATASWAGQDSTDGSSSVLWPGGDEAHAAAGKTLSEEGKSLVERTVRELPKVWVMDEDWRWYAGLLRVGGDGEVDGPYPEYDRLTSWDPTLILDGTDPHASPWRLVTNNGEGRVNLPRDLELPAAVTESANAWREAHEKADEAGQRLDLESLRRLEPEAMAVALREAASTVKRLAEQAWELAYVALEEMHAHVGGWGITAMDASWRSGPWNGADTRLSESKARQLLKWDKKHNHRERGKDAGWFAYAPAPGLRFPVGLGEDEVADDAAGEEPRE